MRRMIGLLLAKALLPLSFAVESCCGQKILQSMIPTDEEMARIIKVQKAHPDIPLGSAEHFLLMLSSISELQARLHLWLFKLDYETLEQVRRFA